MTTTQTESEQNIVLMTSLMKVKRELAVARLSPFTEECQVREMLYDISCDTLAPLPVAIAVLVPPNTRRIMGRERMDAVIAGIETFMRAASAR